VSNVTSYIGDKCNLLLLANHAADNEYSELHPVFFIKQQIKLLFSHNKV